MATLGGIQGPRGAAEGPKPLTPELFHRTGKRRKILPASASKSGSSHTLWQLDRHFRFFCSASGRWEVSDEVAFDERLGTFQSVREYSRAVRPRNGVKRSINPWPQLGIGQVKYDALRYTDSWHNPAAAFTPSDRRLAAESELPPDSMQLPGALPGTKRMREDWDDSRSVGGQSDLSRHSKALSMHARSIHGARTIGGQISEMFAKSSQFEGTATSAQDDASTLYGETERGGTASMFDRTERRTDTHAGTDAATEQMTEKGSVLDRSERRSAYEDATEKDSAADATDRGSVYDATEKGSVVDGWDQTSQADTSAPDPVDQVVQILKGRVSRDQVAAAVREYLELESLPSRGSAAYTKWLRDWEKKYGFKPDLLIGVVPRTI